MPATAPKKRSGSLTRQRIVKAALVRFAKVSYEEVGLRDIALDVGVDVALVHRSFGSKEQLFAEAFKAAIQSERLLSSKKTELGAALARNIFERDNDSTSGHTDALQIFVHSLSSPQAREVLRAFVLKDFIKPLAAKLDDRALQRAALITACLVGVSILRDVLRVKPLLDGSRAESQPLIERIFNVCLDENRETATSTVGPAPAQPINLNPCVTSEVRPKRGTGTARSGRSPSLPSGVG
jgi:AcrR family transcriptional regulator